MRALVLLLGVALLIALTVWWYSGKPATTSTPPATQTQEEQIAYDGAALRGQVLGPSGQPVAGAQVFIMTEAPEDSEACPICGESVFDCHDPAQADLLLRKLSRLGPRKAWAQTQTDHTGMFEFSESPHEVFSLRATSPLGSGITYSTNEQIVLELSPNEPLVLHVVDEHDAPVQASVTLLWRSLRRIEEMTTDATGTLQIDSNTMDVWARISAPGYAQAIGPVGAMGQTGVVVSLAKFRSLVVETRSGASPVSALVEVERFGGAHTMKTQGSSVRFDNLGYESVSVKASGGGLLTGAQQVFLEEPETTLTLELRAAARLLLTLRDENAQPIADVEVDLSSESETVSAHSTASEEPVVLGPVPEGEYRLMTNADSWRAFAEPVDLKAGDNRMTLVLRHTQTIKGVVKDSAGTPIENVEVFLGREHSAATRSNEDGTFELSVDEPGPYLVGVADPQIGTAQEQVTAPADNVVLVVRTGARLQVKVSSESAPVDGALVTVGSVDNTNDYALDTDPDGNVTFVGLLAGAHRVSVLAGGFVKEARVVNLTHDGTETLKVALVSSVSISGSVVDQDGKAQPGVAVVTEPVALSAATDDDGQFLVENIDPRLDYEVRVESTEHEPASIKGVRAPKENLRFVVTKRPQVRGRVLSAANLPLSEFLVDSVFITSPDGRFSLATTSSEIVVSAAQHCSATVAAPTGADLGDIVLQPARAIDGVVVDEAGLPVSNARVHCAQCETDSTTNADGRFSILLASAEESVLVSAARSQQHGAATTSSGFVHITLRAPTRVRGRVLTDGAPPGPVTVTDASAAFSLRLDPDKDGYFNTALFEGVWSFSTRSMNAARIIAIAGDQMEVTLGAAPGSCELILRLPSSVDRVWLLPPSAADEDPWPDLPEGSVSFTTPVTAEAPWRARGITCGSYQLVATGIDKRITQQVTLSPPTTELTIAQ